MAPSQPHLFPVDPFVLSYPFQAMAVDYCSVAGLNYLIAGDRFSDWQDIFHVRPRSRTAGAVGLLDALRT